MSVADETIDFGPLTIFIGPNASGKSAIFKALVTLSKLLGPAPVRGHLGEYTADPAVTLDYLVWKGNSGLPIKFRVWFSDDPDDKPGYTLEIRKELPGWSVIRETMKLGDEWFDSGEHVFEHPTERLGLKRWPSPYRATLCHLVKPFCNDQVALPFIRPLLELKERFGEIWRYRISANDIAAFAKVKKGEPIHVRDNGWGLPLELQRVQGEDRDLFQAIEQQLSSIFTHIRFINFRSERFGVGLAFTTDRSEDLVPATQESDGVLLTLFLIWRLWTAPPNFIVCLEEPENGVHPYLLGERFQLLKKFTDGGGGRKPVQILVATHSSALLRSIEDKAEALEIVRAVEFDPDKGTKVHKLSAMDHIDTLLDAFKNNLGELWWSGAIGAVPSPHEIQE